MLENKYDDPHFFEKYSDMARSRQGLAAAGEWRLEVRKKGAGKKNLPQALGRGRFLCPARFGVIGEHAAGSALCVGKQAAVSQAHEIACAAVDAAQALPQQSAVIAARP